MYARIEDDDKLVIQLQQLNEEVDRVKMRLYRLGICNCIEALRLQRI